MYFVDQDLKNKTGYDLFDIDTSEAVRKITDIPAYFMVSKEDQITPVKVVNELYTNYGCQVKQFAKISGLHHTFRTNLELIQASDFLKRLVEKNTIQKKKMNLKMQQKNKSKAQEITSLGLIIPDEDISINTLRASHNLKGNKPMTTQDEEQTQTRMMKQGFFVGTQSLLMTQNDNDEEDYQLSEFPNKDTDTFLNYGPLYKAKIVKIQNQKKINIYHIKNVRKFETKKQSSILRATKKDSQENHKSSQRKNTTFVPKSIHIMDE